MMFWYHWLGWILFGHFLSGFLVLIVTHYPDRQHQPIEFNIALIAVFLGSFNFVLFLIYGIYLLFKPLYINLHDKYYVWQNKKLNKKIFNANIADNTVSYYGHVKMLLNEDYKK